MCLKRAGEFLALLLVLTWASSVHAQCVDSSEVNGFKVRSVRFRTLFGAIPKNLEQLLNSHRGDSYSANQASKYINEIRNFYATDPAQQKYEELIAQKLKLSIKAGRTWLECVKKIEVAECQRAFGGGNVSCVDVYIRRYFVDVDALDSSPYFLLFPRSALTALYGAMPRPLLALNPNFDLNHDDRFGPSVGLDTATDLLDLPKIFGKEVTRTAALPSSPVEAPEPSPGDIEIVRPTSATAVLREEEPNIEPDKKDTKLLLHLNGDKSLTRDFYVTNPRLALARTNALGTIQTIGLVAQFNGEHVPRGEGDFLRNAVDVGLNADLRISRGPIRLVNIGGAYRYSRDRFTSEVLLAEPKINSENGFESRVIADGSIAKGLLRGGLWIDGGALNGHLGSYHRLASRVGFGKDVVIPRKKEFHEISPPELGGRKCWTKFASEPKTNDPTVGIEVLAGAGKTWGNVPEYSLFYGGAAPGQFLYDELSASTLTDFPTGPILRSQGLQEAGLTLPSGGVIGGSSFWHANVNLSIPISAWSRPLIPHEWVTVSPLRDDDQDFIGHVPSGADVCRDLKSTVKTLVGISGVNLMVNQQARDLLTDGQKQDLRLRNKEDRTPEEDARLAAAEAALSAAKAKVRPEIESLFSREILPVTNFIADNANLFAVKPLLMFDVARLAFSGFEDETRYAAGGGLQLDIVLARFEFGYVAALNRAPGDRRGNFVGRLVLKRFF